MGWSNCGEDSKGRPIGYAHAATCDHPGCDAKIDRGLSYACGGMHGEGDDYCEGYFCYAHLTWSSHAQDYRGEVGATVCFACAELAEQAVKAREVGKPDRRADVRRRDDKRKGGAAPMTAANFTTDNSVTTLLNEAQGAAIRAMDGTPVTPLSLAQLGARVKGAILTQVAVGRWAGLGVVDPDEFVELVVEAVLGNTLIGEPPIRVLYDFKKTSRPNICVESVAKGKGKAKA